MEVTQHLRRLCGGLCLAVATSAAGFAQHVGPDEIIGGPLSGPMPVVNAPFSADAITTVRHTLRDGTRLEQSTTARYYRDSAGRVRVELLMEGLRAPKTMSERHMRLTVYPLTVVHPPAPWWAGYTLDPVTRTARRAGRSLLPLSSGGGSNLGVPVGGVRFVIFTRAQDLLRQDPPRIEAEAFQRESLGTRRIAGVDTTGHRTTVTVPVGLFRNDAPIDLVDEQWESPELRLVIDARYSDSHGGAIEYRLSNIRRTDPPPDLFVVPPDYTMLAGGTADDPPYSAQDGRWVLDGLQWRVER